MEDIYTDALRGILSDHCTPAVVRDIEAGGSAKALWEAIEDSGFADVFIPECDGGAGLHLSEAFPILELCGTSLIPVPLAETMVARSLLAQMGVPRPNGSIALAEGRVLPNGDLVCEAVICGRSASWVLVSVRDSGTWLLPADSAVLGRAVAPLDASMKWTTAAQPASAQIHTFTNLRVWHACVLGAELAGALSAVFTRTLEFANERQQFGRPIGKFQAIQHQLSVIAEHVAAARMAAQLGCNGSAPAPLRVAIAKARTGEAALEVCALSHSIHGAIGFTEEFDLQLFTRRIHAWRQACGSESYWHDLLGQALRDGEHSFSLDFLRATTDPWVPSPSITTKDFT